MAVLNVVNDWPEDIIDPGDQVLSERLLRAINYKGKNTRIILRKRFERLCMMGQLKQFKITGYNKPVCFKRYVYKRL